jgi:PEP-CTERM motif
MRFFQNLGLAAGALGVAAVFAATTGANADVVSASVADGTQWTISGATLVNGDTLSGTFTVLPGGYFPSGDPFELDVTGPAPAPATFGPYVDVGYGPVQALYLSDTVIEAFAGAYNDYLYLAFADPLNAPGPNSLVFGFWCDGSWATPCADPIYLTGPGGGGINAVGVPEPLTLSLFGAGVIGAARLRRRRKASRAA